MTRFQRLKPMLGLRVSREVEEACVYLESHGYEYLVHFNTADAIDLAAEDICCRLEIEASREESR